MQWLPFLNWPPQWTKASPNRKLLSMTDGGREASLTRLFNDKSVQQYLTLKALESTLNQSSFSSCLVQHILPSSPLSPITHLLVPAFNLPNCAILSRISAPKQSLPLVRASELPYYLQSFVTEEPLATRVLFPLGDTLLKEPVTVTFLSRNRVITSMSDLLGATPERKCTIHSFYQGPENPLSLNSQNYYLPTDLRNPIATLGTSYSEICQFCAARGLLECTCAPPMSERAKQPSLLDLQVYSEALSPFEQAAQQDWPSAATHLAAHSFGTVRFSNSLTIDPSGPYTQDRYVSDGTLNYRYQVGPNASPQLEQEFKLRYLPPEAPPPTTGNLPSFSADDLSSILNIDIGNEFGDRFPAAYPSSSSDPYGPDVSVFSNNDQAGPASSPPADNRYKCPECDLLFEDVDRLEVHFGVKHPKSKLVKCDQCGKSFRNRSNRDKHKKIVHLRLMKYPCPVCDDVSFGQRWDLTRHMNSHVSSMHRSTYLPFISKFYFKSFPMNPFLHISFFFGFGSYSMVACNRTKIPLTRKERTRQRKTD